MKSTHFTNILEKTFLLKITVILILALVSFLLLPQGAEAATTGRSNYLNIEHNQYISNEQPVGGKGNYTPSFSFLLYRTNGSTDQLDFVVGAASLVPVCHTYDFYAYRMAGDGDNTADGITSTTPRIPVGGTPGGTGNCSTLSSGGSPYGIRISGLSSHFMPSNRFPGEQVVKITIMIEPANGPNSRFVDVSTLNPGDSLSYLGNPLNSNAGGFDSTGVSYSRLGGGYGNLEQRFAPPCNYGGGQRSVYWKDADSGNDGTVVTARLQRQSGSSWVTIDQRDAENGDDYKKFDFTPQLGRKYRIIFDNVRGSGHANGANTIKIWVPFDSATYDVTCPSPGGGAVNYDPCNSVSWNVSANQSLAIYVGGTNDITGIDTNSMASIRAGTTAIVDYSATGANSSTRDIGSHNPGGRYKYIIATWNHRYNDNATPAWEDHIRGAAIDTCFAATCSTSLVPGSGTLPGGNRVSANQGYTVRYTISNTGILDLTEQQRVSNAQLRISHSGGAGSSGNVPGIASGGTGYVDVPYTAGGSIGSEAQSGRYLDYNGSLALANCPDISVDVYRWYDIAPVATAVFDDVENPTRVDWTGGGSSWTANPGVSVRTSFTEQIFRVNENGSANAIATVVNNQTRDFIATLDGASLATNRATFPPGTRVCAQTTLPAGAGWVGPPVVAGVSSNLINTQARSTPGCDNATGPRVVNKPYVQFYGGDVFAGGNFANGIGGVVNGNIKANYRPATRVGSGVEYAMFALGSVNSGVTTGFSSRSLYGDGASQYDTLNFASGPPKGNFGGAHTVNNYFAYKPSSLQQTLNGPSGNPLASGSTTNDYRLGNFTMVGNNPVTGRHAIFIDGDLYIARNVQYANWADINSIPNVAVIVRGNIYIGGGVTQLDGLYSAEPRANGTGGTIYTCGNPDFTPTTPTIGNCGVRLVVNGAVVAKKVEWLRSIGTLSQGVRGERYNNTQAAEIVRYTPDYLLGTPAYMPSSGQAGGAVDSYRQLPPRL